MFFPRLLDAAVLEVTTDYPLRSIVTSSSYFYIFVEHVHCLFNMLRDLVREEQGPLGGHSRRSMFPKINFLGRLCSPTDNIVIRKLMSVVHLSPPSAGNLVIISMIPAVMATRVLPSASPSPAKDVDKHGRQVCTQPRRLATTAAPRFP